MATTLTTDNILNINSLPDGKSYLTDSIPCVDEKGNVKKIKMDSLRYRIFSRAENTGFLKITTNSDGKSITISDKCGGKIEIIGNGLIDQSIKNFFAKVIRLSFGAWNDYSPLKATEYKKIQKVYLDSSTKTFYVKIGSHCTWCVEGAKNIEMLENEDVDVSNFMELTEYNWGVQKNEVYAQYSGEKNPVTIYGGTWENVTSTIAPTETKVTLWKRTS